VIHQRCSTADAWATALSVLGEDDGFLLAEAQGLQAFFIVRDTDGSFSSKSTTSFSALQE
jgi:thiamine biosynthesis lipoprotein